MKTVIKNIVSFILPVTVLVIVPLLIEEEWKIQSNINLATGSFVGIVGLAIMFMTISSFIKIGKGTLAPWSPTQKLVITGLYRYVRNPMILGVLTVLMGEAIAFGSLPILKWAGLFILINTTYFKLSEEPGLEQRFGDAYLHYKKEVGMWIPRITPYSPEEKKS